MKKPSCKNCEILEIRKAVFKDSINFIQITFFYNSVLTVLEAKGYQVTNIPVSLFQAQGILKTIETTEITEDSNCI